MRMICDIGEGKGLPSDCEEVVLLRDYFWMPLHKCTSMAGGSFLGRLSREWHHTH